MPKKGTPAKPSSTPAIPSGKPSALLDTRVIYCGLRRAPFGSDFDELSRIEPQGRRQSSRDNLEQLAKLPERRIDLTYIGPPFKLNRSPLFRGLLAVSQAVMVSLVSGCQSKPFDPQAAIAPWQARSEAYRQRSAAITEGQLANTPDYSAVPRAGDPFQVVRDVKVGDKFQDFDNKAAKAELIIVDRVSTPEGRVLTYQMFDSDQMRITVWVHDGTIVNYMTQGFQK